VAKIIGPRGPLPPINPPVTPTTKIGAPTGTVPKGKIGGGGSWDLVNRFDPLFVSEGTKHNVDPAWLKSMMLVETGGKNVSDAHGASGVMQIKSEYWADRAKKAGYDLTTDAGQIGMAAAIVGGSIPGLRGTTVKERFLYNYYPVLNSDGSICYSCKGESGHTPQMYLDDIALYSKLINDALKPPITPTPTPTPTPKHPLEIILGGAAWPPVNYGFLSDVGIDAYEFGVGHGTIRSTQHTGDDIGVPHGTKVYAPLPGKITCVGTRGPSTWGQGCGYYVDDMDGGIGNITLVTDAGLKIVFGHCHRSLVQPGDRVVAGQQIGVSGGSNGDHLHLEVAINAPEKVSANARAAGLTYWLLNPIPALRAAMGQPAPQPISPITDIIWEGTQNFHDRRGQVPVAIFYHITDDLNFSNVRSWFQNPTSEASSQFVITRDGMPHQFVGSAKAAWTNGDIKSPRTDIRWMNDAVRRCAQGLANFNDYTIALEFINDSHNTITDAQIERAIQITKYYDATYNIPKNRGHHCRHADVNSVTRPDCPGKDFPMQEILVESGVDPLVLNP